MTQPSDPPPNLTTTLSYNPSDPLHCTFNPQGPFQLVDGQSLVVTLTGFPPASSMNFLALRRKTDSSVVVLFPPGAGTSTSTAFEVSANSDASPLPANGLVVTVTDDEEPDDNDDFDLSFHGTQGGSLNPWGADPEVINKAGGSVGPGPARRKRPAAPHGKPSGGREGRPWPAVAGFQSLSSKV